MADENPEQNAEIEAPLEPEARPKRGKKTGSADEAGAETKPKKAVEAEAPAEGVAEDAVPGPVAEEALSEPVVDEAPVPEPVAEETPAEQPVAEVHTETAATEAAKKAKGKRLPRGQRRQRSKPKPEASPERKPVVRLPKPETERGRSQQRRGVVVSAAMDKTIVVRVESVKAHPRYKKVIRRSKKFHAHDEGNQANVGDVVRIVETRPFSKTKHWRLAEIIEVAK